MGKQPVLWLVVIALLSIALVVGCGRRQGPPPADQYGGYGAPGYGGYGAPGYGGYGAPGYGAQPAQPAAQQPTEPEETAPAGPTYKERYEQGELSAEERREERELQDIERQLGLPVGP